MQEIMRNLEIAYLAGIDSQVQAIKEMVKLYERLDIDHLYYDFDEGALAIHTYDSTDETGYWSETTEYYDVKDDLTFAVRCDQDGGSDIVYTDMGLSL